MGTAIGETNDVRSSRITRGKNNRHTPISSSCDNLDGEMRGVPHNTTNYDAENNGNVTELKVDAVTYANTNVGDSVKNR